MKLFTLLTPNFLVWPIGLSKHFAEHSPEFELAGIVSGERIVFERALHELSSIPASLDWLDSLERRWSETTGYEDDLSEWSSALGDFAIKRMLIADRQLGAGFVLGGPVRPSWLVDRVQDDTQDFHRRYLANMLNYIQRRFSEERPDGVFVYAVAGALAVGLLEMSRAWGIPFLSLSPARLFDTHVLDDSFELDHGPVRRAFCAELERAPNERLVELERGLRFLRDFRERPAAPKYQSDLINQHARKGVTRAVGRLGMALLSRRWQRGEHSRNSVVRSAVGEIRTARRARKVLGRKTFVSAEGMNRRYAYFPLHVDPEASTMVLAPMMTDQLSLITAVAKALPVGMDLVVKEHVPMLGRRPRGFYSQIERLQGVTMVTPEADQFELIRASALTCTITGTAGLEALILKRPVLLFGNPPYSLVGDGFVRARAFDTLPEDVRRALECPPAPEERLALYVECLRRGSVPLESESLWGNEVGIEGIEASPAFRRLTQELWKWMERRKVEGRREIETS